LGGSSITRSVRSTLVRKEDKGNNAVTRQETTERDRGRGRWASIKALINQIIRKRGVWG